jgi:hypothetical protein
LPYQANPKPNGVFGINYLNKQLVELAKLCGFTDPQRNTAHSKRKFTITALLSHHEEIGHQNIKVAARHKTDDANRQYQRSAATLHDRRFRAIWGPGGSKDTTSEYSFLFIYFPLFLFY